MASSLMDGISALLPQVVRPLASTLGESEDAVKRGMESGSAAMIGTLASKVGDSGFLNQILNLITSSGQQMAASATAGAGSSTTGTAAGASLISSLFGSDHSGVTSLISRAAGLRASSASAVMSAAAPLLISVIGQRVRQGGLSAASLGSMLTSEASGLGSFLPSGFSNLTSMASTARSAPAAIVREAESSNKGWLWPVLLLAAVVLGGLIWFLNRGTEPVKEAATTATTAVTDAAKTATSALGDFFKRKLPNGVELNIPQNGIENHLIAFIEDSSKPVDKTTWFDFDRLLFDTGKATLQQTSQVQLQDIANILKAYPNVKIKIGGYTDNVGDKAFNLKLSGDRATNVMAELKGLGVAPTRMSAEGYGEDHPVGDNTTEDGRAKNRRISLRVTEK